MKLFLISILFFNFLVKTHATTFNDCDTCFISYDNFKKMSRDSLLKMFSNNDTATAIIHFFIIKKRRHLTTAVISTGATIVGTTVSVSLAESESRNGTALLAGLEYIILGLAILSVGTVVTLVEGLSGFNYTKSALYKELKYFYENRQLSNKLAKKIFLIRNTK